MTRIYNVISGPPAMSRVRQLLEAVSPFMAQHPSELLRFCRASEVPLTDSVCLGRS